MLNPIHHAVSRLPLTRSLIRFGSPPLAAFLVAAGLSAPVYAQVLTEEGKLIAGDGAFNDQFGYSVDIQGGLVAVGARNQNIFGFNSGSVYIIDEATGALIQKIVPSDGAQNDLFGHSVAISNGSIVVGAYRNDDPFNPWGGAAYLFTAPAISCAADLTGDGKVNFFDVSAFLSAFNAGDPVADFTSDGVFNFFDVSVFLEAFTAGCP